MNQNELKNTILKVLLSVAPDIEAGEIIEDENFREQFDFDSMDFLNFVIGLSKKLNKDISEKDYPKLSSLKSCIAYFNT